METVNVHEAKTHLSRLLDRAAKGETITIAKAGKPIAKLVPIEETPIDTSRRFGFMRGQIKVPDDFDTMGQAEIEAMTPEQVNAAAKALDPNGLTWVVVGDLSKVGESVRALQLGEAVELDVDGNIKKK